MRKLPPAARNFLSYARNFLHFAAPPPGARPGLESRCESSSQATLLPPSPVVRKLAPVMGPPPVMRKLTPVGGWNEKLLL